jgi:hypothetical protein
MRREAKLLLCKAIDSLMLTVEIFNRPSECARATAVLVLLDHSFEMLLKAAIVHRGGKIRKPKERHTLGFGECVRKAFSDGEIKFLSDEQVLLLQMNNSLRDAAQHYLVDVAEPQLYFQTQAGLTMFSDLLMSTFGIDLNSKMPARVLPISTSPIMSLDALFHNQVREIERLLAPGSRRTVEALAKLRALGITEGALNGETGPPTDQELSRLSKAVRQGLPWESIFPGVASLETTATGAGLTMNFRISKKEGMEIRVVPEGTPGAVVVLKRVDEFGFYSLTFKELAAKVNLTTARTTAIIWYLDLKGDLDCSKEFALGKTKIRQYSPKAIDRIREALARVDMDQVWDAWKFRGKTQRVRSVA